MFFIFAFVSASLYKCAFGLKTGFFVFLLLVGIVDKEVHMLFCLVFELTNPSLSVCCLRQHGSEDLQSPVFCCIAFDSFTL